MKRAELVITLGGWSSTNTSYLVGFDTVEKAKGEFDRISNLLKRRGNRENDLPNFLDVEGGNSEFTCNLDMIQAVGLIDMKKSDDEAIGLKDAYPHLAWKP